MMLRTPKDGLPDAVHVGEGKGQVAIPTIYVRLVGLGSFFGILWLLSQAFD